jgi:hypothetical protein
VLRAASERVGKTAVTSQHGALRMVAGSVWLRPMGPSPSITLKTKFYCHYLVTSLCAQRDGQTLWRPMLSPNPSVFLVSLLVGPLIFSWAPGYSGKVTFLSFPESSLSSCQ